MDTITTPRIFLTDYASYNAGTQFEFGHWVDLTDFSDAEELQVYIKAHFEKCDKESPLDSWGSKREEVMFTDFEGFPREFYSESGMDFESIYEWLNLDDYERVAVAILVENGEELKIALDKYDNICPFEWDGSNNAKYELFEIYYPDAEKVENQNPYVSIDYDRFINQEFTEFTIDGQDYLVRDSDLANY